MKLHTIAVSLFILICQPVAAGSWEAFKSDLETLVHATTADIQRTDIGAAGFWAETDFASDPTHAIVAIRLQERNGTETSFPVWAASSAQFGDRGESELLQSAKLAIVKAWDNTFNVPPRIFEPLTWEQAHFQWSSDEKDLREKFRATMVSASPHFIPAIQKVLPKFRGWTADLYINLGMKSIMVSLQVENEFGEIDSFPVAHYRLLTIRKKGCDALGSEAFYKILDQISPPSRRRPERDYDVRLRFPTGGFSFS